MLAQVMQRGTVGKRVRGKERDGRRKQYLTTMTRGHESRGPIEGRAEVVTLAKGGLSGVEDHSDAKRARLAPRLADEVALCIEAGADAVYGRVEDRHEPIANRLHDMPCRTLHGVPQDRVVAFEGPLHGVLVVLPEPGAAFDVGEEEGERSRRRRSTLLPPAYSHAVRIRPAQAATLRSGASDLLDAARAGVVKESSDGSTGPATLVQRTCRLLTRQPSGCRT